MKKLTEDQAKIDLVAKLVKDGAIDFKEAIDLLEVEVVTEYIGNPFTTPYTYPSFPPIALPYNQGPVIPVQPYYVGSPITINNPFNADGTLFISSSDTMGWLNGIGGSLTCIAVPDAEKLSAFSFASNNTLISHTNCEATLN